MKKPDRPNRKARHYWVTILAVRPVVLALLIYVGLEFGALNAVGSAALQNEFQVDTLDTGWGTLDADFSPACCSVAVYAYRGEPVNGLVQHIQQIQIWDYRSRKLSVSREIIRVDRPKTDVTSLDPGFVRYGDGGRELVVYEPNEGQLLALSAGDLESTQKIDLNKSAWPPVAPNPSGIHSYVSDIQLDRRGDRVAVAFSWGVGLGGELRVYSFSSGSLLKKWGFQNDSLGGISIDPDGHKVAVPVIPFPPGERQLGSSERNVFVFDIDSGKTIIEINTGYLAAEVRFVGSSTVATVSAERGLGAHRKDGIRLWDTKTGTLIREIRSSPNGVRYRLEVSTNERIVLGYVGKEVNHWWWFDPASVITEYDRFRLWELATGRVIATSSDVPPRSGYRLSPGGDVALTYSRRAGGPLTFYKVQSIN